VAQYLSTGDLPYPPYRVGGDQFALIFKNCREKKASELVENIRARLKEPWKIGSMEHLVKFHCGMVLYPQQVQDPESAVHSLTFTIAEAKRSNTFELTLFNEILMEKREKRSYMRTLLEERLTNKELVVHYQPVYELSTMRIVKAEALVRIMDHTGEMIYPSDFIPIAEESGLILDLTNQVLDQVSEVYSKISFPPEDFERISINYSIFDMMQPRIEERTIEKLHEHKLNPCKLEIELTETAMIESYDEIKHSIASMMDDGITFALDDFGKGFSNVKTLISLPFHIVKLDKEILSFGVSRKFFLEAVANTLHKLGKKVVVEGVETISQLDICKEMNIDYVQGYLLSKPLQELHFLRLLEDQKNS
jgi:EAL domain-containing protein (putative c-di-GMP-specific phosphodiesterase class I)